MVRFDASAQVAPGDMSSLSASAAVAARNEALKRTALGAKSAATAAPSDSETPPPPITESDVSKGGFEGAPLTYSIDLSSMIMGGPTKNEGSLPGGMDAELLYKASRTTRLAANYYQFSATSIGNDDPGVPIVFQGTRTPIGYLNAGAAGVDSTTHLRFQIYSVQQMFFVGGRHHPLIFAPAYASIRSIIAGKDDAGTIFANGQVMTVHQRSYEFKALNLVIPLFYGEKYLISYAGGAIWNINTNGANVTNHPQYLQSGYLQYQPDQSLTLFANIAKVITYFPTDVYPYHVPTFHYGISKTIKSPFWVEGEVSTGGPSNPNYTDFGRVGLVNLTVPCARTAAGGSPTLTCVALASNGIAIPVVGAQRYTTFSVMFGIGANPLVRPF
jgi:hypothetical protein